MSKLKIYLDYIFFENLFVSLLTIYIVSKLSKEKVSFKWNIFVSLIYSVYSVLSYVYITSFLASAVFKFLIVLSITYIYFRPKTVKKYLKLQMIFFLIIYVYTGTIIFFALIFNINLNNIFLKFFVYITSFAITYLSTGFLWKMWISKIKKRDLEYEIFYNLGKKRYTVLGFVDTGNSLKDSVSGLDVVIVSKKYMPNKDELNSLEFRKINIKSINGIDCYIGYVFKNLKFKNYKKEYVVKNALIVFAEEYVLSSTEYNAIISYNTYLEKLEGVFL